MISKKSLTEAHLYSWKELSNILGNLGSPPYINFSDEPAAIPRSRALPESLYIRFGGNRVANTFYLTHKKYGAIQYYIGGTHVPPSSRMISGKVVLSDVIKANALNAFSQVNPAFFSFFNYSRIYHHLPTEGKVAEMLDPFVTGIPDYFFLRLASKPALEKMIKKDKFYKEIDSIGLKNAVKEPWRALEQVMWSNKEPELTAKLADVEEMNHKFA